LSPKKTKESNVSPVFSTLTRKKCLFLCFC